MSLQLHMHELQSHSAISVMIICLFKHGVKNCFYFRAYFNIFVIGTFHPLQNVPEADLRQLFHV